MSRKIFIYDKNKKEWVEANKEPSKFDDTRNHVNMRTTWSGTTKVEFSQTTVEKDIANRLSR
tara:strand:+ start:557 stop:742 length:186 start_codon:yes stop_codon:yes gene_type:complete